MSWSTRQSITKRVLVTVLGLLCTQVCRVTATEVEQRPPALSLQEGASSMLQCNFSSTPANVQWYLQDPGGRLSLLFSVPSGTKQHGRLNSTTVAKELRSSLYISSSKTADSATYFCAWSHSAPQAPAACVQTLLWAWLLLQPPSAQEPTSQPTTQRMSGVGTRRLLLLQIWDFGLHRPFSIWCLFFFTINLSLGTRGVVIRQN
uniref:Ig-like domain-containing protein n=1 Tax=Ursus maritimus TaxID=29073 RepID=A0A452UWF8_URSMA